MQTIIINTLNRYLDCDPENAGQLGSIEQKIIFIVIKEIKKTLKLQVQDMHLQEVVDDEQRADITITLSIKALPDLLMGVDQNQLMKNGDIEIEGDSYVASVLQNTLRAIEIDWEEILSKYVGDTAAYQVGLGVKKFSKILADKKTTARLDVRDYLQDNVQVAPTKEEVDDFISEVDEVRAHMDRLEARINRLKPTA